MYYCWSSCICIIGEVSCHEFKSQKLLKYRKPPNFFFRLQPALDIILIPKLEYSNLNQPAKIGSDRIWLCLSCPIGFYTHRHVGIILISNPIWNPIGYRRFEPNTLTHICLGGQYSFRDFGCVCWMHFHSFVFQSQKSIPQQFRQCLKLFLLEYYSIFGYFKTFLLNLDSIYQIIPEPDYTQKNLDFTGTNFFEPNQVDSE